MFATYKSRLLESTLSSFIFLISTMTCLGQVTVVMAKPSEESEDRDKQEEDEASSYVDAVGNYINAVGNYEVQKRNAELIGEQARSMRLDTNLKRADALQKQWTAWSEKRAKAHAEYRERMAEGRRVKFERRATIHREAYRLPRGTVEPTSGEITWPACLHARTFSVSRTKVEERFRDIASYGDADGLHCEKVSTEIEGWRKSLRTNISTMPSAEYIAAQKFLLGLKFEAESMAGASASEEKIGSKLATVFID